MDFEIKPAEFKIIPNIAFVGKSSSGKTYSALLFARGYVGKQGKIIVIDTENERSLCYAGDSEIGHFDVLSLQAPYTSERYIQAYIQACMHVGKDGAVIIDSMSHEWEGIGGILEEVEKFTGKNKVMAWNLPKRRHNKLVHQLANPQAMTILTFRIKDKMIDATDPSKGYVEDIVTEKNFKFDLTTVIKFEPNTHKAFIEKLPKPLHGAIKNGDIITLRTGEIFKAELSKGKIIDFDDVDVVQVKVAGCETDEDLKNLYRFYQHQNHPKINEIADFCKKQKAVMQYETQEV